MKHCWDENASPDERLFRVGILFSLVARKQADNQDIASTCNEFIRMCKGGKLNTTFNSLLPGSRGLAVILRKLLTETVFYRQNKVLCEYHQQLVSTLRESAEDPNNIDMEALLKARTPELNQFIKECGHGLVNMMLHWIYSNHICRSPV